MCPSAFRIINSDRNLFGDALAAAEDDTAGESRLGMEDGRNSQVAGPRARGTAAIVWEGLLAMLLLPLDEP